MIPSASDPRWGKIIDGQLSHEYKFLALKIILTRLQSKAKQNPAEKPNAINELVEFFNKHQALLTDDIKAIFG